VFMGTPALAVPALEGVARNHRVVAVLTQPDRPSGRGRQVRASAVKLWAREHDIDVLQPPTLRDSDLVRQLQGLEPEAIVVVAYGLLLPSAVLQLPSLGCVNVHASLLPRHRGASPIQAAILAGDSVTGVTTMLMDPGLDTGPVLLQRSVPLRDDDTSASLGTRLAAAGAELVVQTLPALAAGQLQPRPQEESLATLTRRVTKADGRLDWCRPGIEIDRRVRAMQPWPGAWTEWGQERLRIFGVRVLASDPDRVRGASPGQVVQADDQVLVACGNGLVEIHELQRPGGRRLPGAAFARGAPRLLGQVLGRPR